MRYFITHIIPRDLLIKYNVPTAPYNFSTNLISSGVFDKVYSLLPTNIYDYCGPIETPYYTIIYSRIRNKHRIVRFIGAFLEEIRLFKIIKPQSSVWLYNLSFFDVLYVRLLRIFKPSVKIYTIVLDFTPGERGNRFALPLINKSDGMITLSQSSLFTNPNSICLAGIVPETEPKPLQTSPIKREFLISGNLDERISSLTMLLEVFSQIPDCILHITGTPKDKLIVEQYAKKYNNIIFHGMMEFSDYLELVQSVPFVLSTRDPHYPENECNFPSKIIESLLYNRIIISTIAYEQLEKIKYFVVHHDSTEFSNSIKKIVSMNDNELLSFANQSELTKNLFNVDVWSESIQKIENQVSIKNDS